LRPGCSSATDPHHLAALVDRRSRWRRDCCSNRNRILRCNARAGAAERTDRRRRRSVGARGDDRGCLLAPAAALGDGRARSAAVSHVVVARRPLSTCLRRRGTAQRSSACHPFAEWPTSLRNRRPTSPGICNASRRPVMQLASKKGLCPIHQCSTKPQTDCASWYLFRKADQRNEGRAAAGLARIATLEGDSRWRALSTAR
jgi:hypothetical protein